MPKDSGASAAIVGRSGRRRDNGGTNALVRQKALAARRGALMAIGREPLWAIGSGKVPTSGEIAKLHAHPRSCLVDHLAAEGSNVRILHGGSFNPEDARIIRALPKVGGVLVGGASLLAEPFLAIAARAGRSQADGVRQSSAADACPPAKAGSRRRRATCPKGCPPSRG